MNITLLLKKIGVKKLIKLLTIFGKENIKVKK